MEEVYSVTELSTEDPDDNSSASWRPLARKNPRRVEGRRPRRCCLGKTVAKRPNNIVITIRESEGSRILSQGRRNDRLGHLMRKNMEKGIRAASTPLRTIQMDPHRARHPIRPQSLTRRPQHYTRTLEDPEAGWDASGEEADMPPEGTPPGRKKPNPAYTNNEILGNTLMRTVDRILNLSSKDKKDLHVRIREGQVKNRKATRIVVWETQGDTDSASEGGREAPTTPKSSTFYKIVPNASETDEYRDNNQCGLVHAPINGARIEREMDQPVVTSSDTSKHSSGTKQRGDQPPMATRQSQSSTRN